MLSTLILCAGHDGLETVLRHIADCGARAIPGANGARLSLHEDDRIDTVVASAGEMAATAQSLIDEAVRRARAVSR